MALAEQLAIRRHGASGKEGFTMITYMLALAIYLGVVVLLLALLAVLSRANGDDAEILVFPAPKAYSWSGERAGASIS